MSVKIVLAEDYPIVREGFRALLSSQKDFEIVGETGDGLQAMRLVEQLKPNVLVLDLMMPALGGLEVTRQLKQRVPETRVIVLSMHADEGYVSEALKNGAAGYVLKGATSAELVRAVREVMSGRRYLSPPLSERAIEAYAQKSRATEVFDRYDTLSSREREVFHLAAEGHTNAEIAGRLYISPRTVETHRAHVMRKLRLRTHTDLIRYALQRGIIHIEPAKKKVSNQ